MATKGPCPREEALWVAWANSSLPVPVSPMINTRLSAEAAILASLIWRMNSGALPLMSSKTKRAVWPETLRTSLKKRRRPLMTKRTPACTWSCWII